MFVGLVLSGTGIVLFVWAMFRLAIYALPTWFGVNVFLWATMSGPGPLLGILLGLVVGLAAFLAGRMLIASPLPALVRAGIALLFALPAGVAGHSVVSGLMQLGGAGPTSTTIFAVLGGIIIAGAALMSLVSPMTDPNHPHVRLLRN